MQFCQLSLALTLGGLIGWTGPLSATEPLSPEQFTVLQQLIKPQSHEAKWARLPWLTNLAEARRRAAAEDKPILLWRAGGGATLGRA